MHIVGYSDSDNMDNSLVNIQILIILDSRYNSRCYEVHLYYEFTVKDGAISLKRNGVELFELFFTIYRVLYIRSHYSKSFD